MTDPDITTRGWEPIQRVRGAMEVDRKIRDLLYEAAPALRDQTLPAGDVSSLMYLIVAQGMRAPYATARALRAEIDGREDEVWCIDAPYERGSISPQRGMGGTARTLVRSTPRTSTTWLAIRMVAEEVEMVWTTKRFEDGNDPRCRRVRTMPATDFFDAFPGRQMTDEELAVADAEMQEDRRRRELELRANPPEAWGRVKYPDQAERVAAWGRYLDTATGRRG